MHRFNFYLPIELFNRIRLMAEYYNLNISKMMTKLLEIGYIDMIKGDDDHEFNHK